MRTRRDPLAVIVLLLCGAALAYLTIHIMLFLFPTHGKPQRNPPSTFESMAVVLPTVLETTTTTEAPPPPTTTTTEVPRTTTTRASRGAPRTTQPTTEVDDDFWRRLANCESVDGSSGSFVGYFQFSYDTARKVGIDGSESYEVQKDAAIDWASRIHPNEGTSSGWPHCWWVALSQQG